MGTIMTGQGMCQFFLNVVGGESLSSRMEESGPGRSQSQEDEYSKQVCNSQEPKSNRYRPHESVFGSRGQTPAID